MEENNNKGLKQLVLWGGAFFMLLLLLSSLKNAGAEREIPYSQFKQLLKAGRVEAVTVRADMIRGTLIGDEGRAQRFRTLPLPDLKLVEDLETSNVKRFSGEPDRSWVTALIVNIGWVVLFFGLWYLFVVRQVQMGGKQAMSFGRSRTKAQDPKKNKTTFADVAGCDEAKEELEEVIQFLKSPEKFMKLGGKIPRGVLLYGPPGTGKTLLARAVAGEAGVPFYNVSGSEFVEMFVGVGASRVRDLFEQAKKHPSAVIFIDELDAVGRSRFAGIGGGHDEREQTLNQILIELDGFDRKEGIILVAATNRPDVLDPALLRPGRFDRQIVVSAPDLKGREEIFKVHMNGVKVAEGVDVKVLSQRTPGFVGADLANVVNEAALLAARRGKESVEMPEFEDAIERVIAGPSRKSRLMSEEEKRTVAYHECGHTLVAKLSKHSDPVHKVSIVPRGQALGYTLQLPDEDRYLTSKEQILSKLAVLLGGRCAEELAFDRVTTGASDDLSKATAYAQRMVTEFGMSDKVGPLSLRKSEGQVFLGRDIATEPGYSESTAKLIDEEIKRIVETAKKTAMTLLTKNRKILDKMADTLYEKEVLDNEEIEKIIKEGGGALPATA